MTTFMEMTEEEQEAYSERRRSYEPNDLPDTVKRKLYLTYGVGTYNRGEIQISDRGDSSSKYFETVVLTEFEIEVDVPKNVNVTSKYISMLKKERARISREASKNAAKYILQLRPYDERIRQLTAIEHKPVAKS